MRSLWAVIPLLLLGYTPKQPAPSPSPPPPSSPQPRQTVHSELAGTAWRVVEFRGGDGTVLRADDPAKYTVELGTNGFVAVRIDCNRGRGSWTSSGPGHLELGPLALTRAACPAPLTDRLAKDWTYVRSYVMKDGHLFLSLMADGGIYELEPMSADAGASLEGSDWTLAGAAANPQARPRLQFDRATQRVSGFTGCNRLSGTYSVEGDHLTFGPLATTKMACLEGMEAENAFLEALNKVTRYRIEAGSLELLDDAGSALLRLSTGSQS